MGVRPLIQLLPFTATIACNKYYMSSVAIHCLKMPKHMFKEIILCYHKPSAKSKKKNKKNPNADRKEIEMLSVSLL